METFGCSANQSHSEVMMGLLEKEGFSIVKEPEEADVLIVNTCAVKEPTEKRILYKIRELRKKFPEKKMIIAGCMPVAEYEILRSKEPLASLLGPRDCLKIGECVKKTLKGLRVDYLGNKRENKLFCERKRLNPLVAVVEISQGCLGVCSYCIVKKAKGCLSSYPVSDIIKSIEMSLKQGCREVWLTSQDCGCYGKDINSSLVELMRQVTDTEGDFRVRLGMSNPNHVKPLASDLIELYGDKKIYKFLHLPLQSGSNIVLRDMKRHYETEDFKELVKKFRKELPFVTIWTDVIVGFPGETEKDFKETISLLKETKPDFVNASKYGNRPGTEAEKMEQVPGEVIKSRSRELGCLVEKLNMESNKRWLGKECQVLVTERGRGKNQYTGRNEAYKSVLIETERDLLGKFVTVKINDSGKRHLKGFLKSRNQPD